MVQDTWQTLLAAWLHDPVDKAADIPGHFSRAVRYAAEVMGREVSETELKDSAGDQIASAYERLPMPDARGRYQELGVGPEGGRLRIVHPLSGEMREIRTVLEEARVRETLRSMVAAGGDAERRFLTLWRLAPERLAALNPDYEQSPAETRCPDHSIFQHLDTTAAMALALKGGKGGAALLSFKLGPVQPFIEAARSLRDLLTGSYILSDLAWAAILKVVERYGPAALVYPNLRGVPVMDAWLRQRGVEAPEPDPAALARPSLPHRFLALAPQQDVQELAQACRDAAQERWKQVAASVRAHLGRDCDKPYAGWDRLWDAQVESYFDGRTVVVRFAGAGLGAEALKPFEGLKKLGRAEPPPGTWQAMFERSAALMDASARVRHIPRYHPPPPVPAKCTLLGTYEQMGPARLADSAGFWQALEEKGVQDRLCAISLIKRLAYRAFYKRERGLDWEDLRFDDTETFARKDGGRTYYAVLMMDGDDMGKWLSGDKSPTVGSVLHPKVRAWHERNTPGAREALELKRPVSPALHATISAALTRFATRTVPRIVEQSGGMLVYAGGDDVLAVLHVSKAFGAARQLRKAFSAWEALGSRATCSAGLVIAHAKEDLRAVLGEARAAERRAKNAGKDRLGITAMRRSGEHAAAVCTWDYAATLEGQMDSFGRGMSDRWAYLLRRQAPILKNLPAGAFEAELKRLVERSEKRDTRFIEDLARFLALEQGRSRPEAVEDFVTLAQTASFMVRGKD